MAGSSGLQRLHATSPKEKRRSRHCAPARSDSEPLRTILRNWPGPQTSWVGRLGTTGVGSNTPEQRLKKCSTEAGRKCTTPTTSSELRKSCRRQLIKAKNGRIPSRFEEKMANTAGFCHGQCRSGTRVAKSNVGSARTLTSRNYGRRAKHWQDPTTISKNRSRSE